MKDLDRKPEPRRRSDVLLEFFAFGWITILICLARAWDACLNLPEWLEDFAQDIDKTVKKSKRTV